MGLLSKLFRIEEPEMVTLRIIPDRTTDNRQNHKLVRALHELYSAPLGRLHSGRWFIRYTPKAKVWYDVLITNKEIKFYFTIPAKWEIYARQKISGCWPRASVDRADANELRIPLDNSNVTELAYKRHNIFALHVDRTEDTQPLAAIMAVCGDMSEGDVARLSICADPLHRLNWQDQAEAAHRQFSAGKTPQRRGFSKKRALISLGGALEGLFEQLGEVLLAVLGHGDDKPDGRPIDQEKRQILIDGQLQRGTTAKRSEPTFSTTIRVASHSTDVLRRHITSVALANSFVEIAGDNELEPVPVRRGKSTIRALGEINQHRLSKSAILDLDKNVMSAGELGKLCQIPGAGLQDTYAEQVQTIRQRQDGPPASVTKGGLVLGHAEIKNERIPIYAPTGNLDEFCLPSIIIGGMGCGKTQGQGANLAVEAALAGMGCVTIDPAKKELGAEIMSVLPPEMYTHIDLSKVKISLDWRESFHAEYMTTRLANAILSFFRMDGSEMQTERFLFAAVVAMKTRRLSEILKILEDEKYRGECVAAMPESINKSTLLEFNKYSPERQRAIMAPIYNRMAVIFRDQYLAECMECAEGLDFYEIMQRPGVTIIDIPDSAFDPMAKDLLVNLISTKIDMAMRLRPDTTMPYVVILDEPHQYLKSADLWRGAAVESRKFRVKYAWMFHSFEQIPNALAEIVLAAGPHFHVYRSSAKTFQALRHYLEPYGVEDITKMPRFQAINILRANGETTRPFMARMAPPPSARLGKEDKQAAR